MSVVFYKFKSKYFFENVSKCDIDKYVQIKATYIWVTFLY